MLKLFYPCFMSIDPRATHNWPGQTLAFVQIIFWLSYMYSKPLNSTHGKLFSYRSRKEDLRYSVSKVVDWITKVWEIVQFPRQT